jgi:archaeosine-15-forming tRNA-guanine transglycosylase
MARAGATGADLLQALLERPAVREFVHQRQRKVQAAGVRVLGRMTLDLNREIA